MNMGRAIYRRSDGLASWPGCRLQPFSIYIHCQDQLSEPELNQPSIKVHRDGLLYWLCGIRHKTESILEEIFHGRLRLDRLKHEGVRVEI